MTDETTVETTDDSEAVENADDQIAAEGGEEITEEAADAEAENRKAPVIALRKTRQWARIENSALYIYGAIGDDPQETERVVKSIRNFQGDALTVYINSPGGDVSAGLAIYDAMTLADYKKVTVVDGIAASMGSVIFAAGDERRMPENAELMVHWPWTIAIGNSQEFLEMAEFMEASNKRLLEIYAGIFSGTEDELRALLDDETYISAADAVGHGLATEVMKATRLAASTVRPKDFHDVTALMNWQPPAEEDDSEAIRADHGRIDKLMAKFEMHKLVRSRG